MTDGVVKGAMGELGRGTKGKFAAMVGVYFCGTLNDNFCRQCLMMIAVAAGMPKFQSYITILFTAPFIVFAAYAGYLSDKFSKRSVVIGTKIASVIAYIIGAAALYFMNWPVILALAFLLGLQATIFSPAINGTIPELYPPQNVPAANGIIVAAVNIAILLGIAGAGLVLDIKGASGDCSFGIYLAGGTIIGLAFITLVISTLVPKFPAASPNAKFPWQGPWESIVMLAKTAEDPILAIMIFAKGFFWFAGALQILIINELGLTQFGLSKTMTSVLVVVELLGIGLGSLLSPLMTKSPKWPKILAPSSLIMAVAMFAVAGVPYLPSMTHIAAIIGALALMGIAGGIFSIPVTSFIQIRPKSELKGRMIALSNFADFIGILISGVAFYVFSQMQIKPSNCFAIEALIVMAMAGWLMVKLPGEIKND